MDLNNRVKAAFDCIHAEEELKQNTMAFLRQRCYEEKKPRRVPIKPLAAVVVCLLLALAGWDGYSTYFTSVSTISVDVNPSIELEVNRFDAVIRVEAYNEDGADVVSAVDIRFQNYRKALEQLLQDGSMSRYLTPDQVVEITVFGADETRNREMLENLTACTASYGNFHCATGDAEVVDEAHSAGLSCGKYRAFSELQALDPDITVEDVKGWTMRQIRDQIAALKDAAEEAVPEDSTAREDAVHDCGSENDSGNGAYSGNGTNNGIGGGNGSGSGNSAGHGKANGNGKGYHREHRGGKGHAQ